MLRTRPFLATLALSLLAPALLAGCTVGTLDDDTGSNDNDLRGEPAGDRLRWASLTSSCAHGANIVANGDALTVLFDRGTAWSQCTFSGVLRVPSDVRLVGLAQQVRTEGRLTPIRYSARVNGTQVTARATSSRDTLDAYASLAALGDALCRKPGHGARDVPIAFTAAIDGDGVSLDSVDWAVSADDCE